MRAFCLLAYSAARYCRGHIRLEKSRAQARVLLARLLGGSLTQGIYKIRKGSRFARFVRSPTRRLTQAPPDEGFALEVLILFAPLTISYEVLRFIKDYKGRAQARVLLAHLLGGLLSQAPLWF